MVIHWNISIYLCKGILYKIHFLTKNVLKMLLNISYTSLFHWLMSLHFGFQSYTNSSFQSASHFSHSVVSISLWPNGLQHARPPCLFPTPGVYSNSCPLSQWCHPTISSAVLFSSHLQSFPASGSLPMIQFFASDNQSIEVML